MNTTIENPWFIAVHFFRTIFPSRIRCGLSSVVCAACVRFSPTLINATSVIPDQTPPPISRAPISHRVRPYSSPPPPPPFLYSLCVGYLIDCLSRLAICVIGLCLCRINVYCTTWPWSTLNRTTCETHTLHFLAVSWLCMSLCCQHRRRLQISDS